MRAVRNPLLLVTLLTFIIVPKGALTPTEFTAGDIAPRATVCVVMAAGGYRKAYKKGHPISGLDKGKRMKDVVVFHAGTAAKNKQVVANGGRVLGVTALGDTVELAIKKAYQAVAKIKWTKVHYRTDIGRKALVRMSRTPKVGVVMGSDSDLPVMEKAADVLAEFAIAFELTILFGGLMTLLGLLVVAKLPSRSARRRPNAYSARFSAEEFGLVVDCKERDVLELSALLRDYDAKEVTLVEP